MGSEDLHRYRPPLANLELLNVDAALDLHAFSMESEIRLPGDFLGTNISRVFAKHASNTATGLACEDTSTSGKP